MNLSFKISSDSNSETSKLILPFWNPLLSKIHASLLKEAVALIEGTHYRVEYQKNVDKGTATIIFAGIESGGYTGAKKQTFKITAAGVSDITNEGVVKEQIQVAFKKQENVRDGIYVTPHMKSGAKPVKNFNIIKRVFYDPFKVK